MTRLKERFVQQTESGMLEYLNTTSDELKTIRELYTRGLYKNMPVMEKEDAGPTGKSSTSWALKAILFAVLMITIALFPYFSR